MIYTRVAIIIIRTRKVIYKKSIAEWTEAHNSALKSVMPTNPYKVTGQNSYHKVYLIFIMKVKPNSTKVIPIGTWGLHS